MTAFGETTIVPVLGMHRSGTSMITRALNILGLELGAPLLKPHADNPRGFWEHEFFISVNIRILETFRVNPDGLAPAADLIRATRDSGRVAIDSATAAAIAGFIDKTFVTETWGWKDPRTVLLFPFWIRVLREIGYSDIRPLIITRNVDDCVPSLLRRGNLGSAEIGDPHSDSARAAEMWSVYNEICLSIADNLDACVCRYEAFLDPASTKDELCRCAEFAGLSTGNLSDAIAWITPQQVEAQT